MKRGAAAVLLALLRVGSLVFLAVLGTVVLMRYAPGYFTDSREMDGRYAAQAQASLQAEQQHGSLAALSTGAVQRLLHGDLGRSRQFDVPVGELIGPRAKVTAKLLFSGIACGWCAAFVLALPLSARRTRKGEALIAAPSALLLAVPVGAMTMMCMMSGAGGPLLVLTLLIAARDFKFVYRILKQAWTSPHLLFASAQGIPRYRVALKYVLPPLRTEMFSLAMMSVVLALSAIVPVEVIFDVPGLGQLAWSAAMNRDLPVLLSVTLLMATCIGFASLFAEPERRMEAIQCA